jgi:beta-N-acetylhexosaminidase
MEDILNQRSRKPVFLCVAVIILFCLFLGSMVHIQGIPDEAQKWANETLAKLTLEKKIGQMVCTDIAGGYIADDDPRLKQWVRLARDYGVGGFVLYGGTPRDVAHLLNRLQKVAELPLLMSVDFEGGPGQQVRGASEFPANMAFAAAGSEELMYEAAKVGAIEGRAMGFHLTYTPVVDISLSPENPAESVRSFGGDLDLLGRLVRAYVKGYQENGMLTTAKHFPGRGDTEALPDFPGFNCVNKPAVTVEEQEFRAFKYAIDAGVTFVMSEHIAIPSVTGGSELPASVEQKLATEWLRHRLGFKGILTTDDLWYDHVIKRFGPVEVAIKAIEAGHDVILKPKDPIATIQGVVAAVRSGRIAESRVDRSVRKLLYRKARLNLHKNRFIDEERVNAIVGIPAHLEVVQKVADQSLTLLKNDGILPIESGGLGSVVNISVQKYESDTSPDALTAKLEAVLPGVRNFILRPDMNPAEYDKIWPYVSEADLVILSLFIQRNRAGDPAPFREGDLAFIHKIIAAKPNAVIAMSYGNPHLIRKIGDAAAFLVGYGEGGWYGNQVVYFDSFIKLLQGKLKPRGKLPVKVSDRYPIGSGLGY